MELNKWIFARQQNCSERTNPYDDKLFKENCEDEEFNGISFLVRESIQNSLDAVIPENHLPVKVVFHLKTFHWSTEKRKQIHSLFQRVAGPLKAINGFNLENALNSPMNFLIYEDFNTRGLEGDPRRLQEPAPNHTDPEDFFWFWRNSGISGKTGGRGRWGLGKTVFNAAGMTNSRFGLTLRKSDKRLLLMGKTVLQLHKFHGDEFEPYGFWGNQEKTQTSETDCIPLPIEEPAEITEFCKLWDLTPRTEPGLTVIVPFLKNIHKNRLIQIATANFFVSILQGDLVVEIEEDGKTERLDATTFSSCTARFFNEKACEGELIKRFRTFNQNAVFFQKCLKLSDSVLNHIDLPEKTIPKRETLENALKTQLNNLREKYLSGELLPFEIRFRLKHAEENFPWGIFRLFLQKNPDSERIDFCFTRNGMTIPKPAGGKGFRGLFLTDESNPENRLSKFLGDSEGPAHEDWEKVNLAEKKWEQFTGRLAFVLNVAKDMHEILRFEKQQINRSIFANFFPDSRSSESKTGQNGRSQKSVSQTVPQIPQSKSWYRISQSGLGFEISSTGEPIPPDPQILIRAAYCTLQGNPFKKWSHFDFSFYVPKKRDNEAACGLNTRNFSFSSVNAKLRIPSLNEKMEGNVLILQILNPEEPFRFSVKGFSPIRDLYLEIIDQTSSDTTISEDLK